jgi:ketosteroid isomerase-like protein
MTTETTNAHDEARIRQGIAEGTSAFCVKDLDRQMSHYATDVTVFDVKPPFQTKEAAAWRRTLGACLPYFPDSFAIETRDLSIIVSGDLALAILCMSVLQTIICLMVIVH